MADIVIDKSEVSAAYVVEQFTGTAGQDILPGQVVYPHPGTGFWMLAMATNGNHQFLGIALSDSKKTGGAITVITKGIVDLGNSLDALGFDNSLYLSDTPGAISDTEGTNAYKLGDVFPGFQDEVPRKLMRVTL